MWAELLWSVCDPWWKFTLPTKTGPGAQQSFGRQLLADAMKLKLVAYNSLDCDHKDSNASNNNLVNLRFTTARHNRSRQGEGRVAKRKREEEEAEQAEEQAAEELNLQIPEL